MAGFCTQCGATLAGHERFCPTCGTAVNAEQHAAPTAPQPAPPAPPPAASAPWSAPGAYAPPGQARPAHHRRPHPAPACRTHRPNWYPPPRRRPRTRRRVAALATWLQVLLWIAARRCTSSRGSSCVVVRGGRAGSFYDAPAGSDFDEAQRWIDREDLGPHVVQGFSWFVGHRSVRPARDLGVPADSGGEPAPAVRTPLVAGLGGGCLVHPARELRALPDDPVGGREDRHGRSHGRARSVEVDLAAAARDHLVRAVGDRGRAADLRHGRARAGPTRATCRAGHR